MKSEEYINYFKIIRLRTVLIIYFLILFVQTLVNLLNPIFFQHSSVSRDDVVWLSKLFELIFLIFLLLLFSSKLFKIGEWKKLSVNILLKVALAGALFGVIMGFYLVCISTQSSNSINNILSGKFFILIILATILNEIIFRGLIQTSLVQLYGVKIGTASAATMFMFMHQTVLLYPLLFMYSLLAGYIYNQSNRVECAIIFGVIVHFLSFVVVHFFA